MRGHHCRSWYGRAANIAGLMPINPRTSLCTASRSRRYDFSRWSSGATSTGSVAQGAAVPSSAASGSPNAEPKSTWLAPTWGRPSAVDGGADSGSCLRFSTASARPVSSGNALIRGAQAA